ncbi:response regulator transcription factor [Bacillus sp. BRMEA1]|uniref:response regulator transcription factor n=1 Tax=Neobacillus endophyticus TaxID=2738405 RepID=UPI001565678E|nr:response regulator transcription factor [Neobacillus endophyticus]NRD77886.1 response regulator transcription factor [Neobacillus endophyticus]
MKQILIIEDDENIAELERDYLQLNGYQVTIIADGLQGMNHAVSGKYDVIIVDLMLPNKDGFQILKAVRSKMEIPVIIVSAKTEDIDKIRGLGYGADDYLTKPFSPSELVARVKSHINRYERLMGKNTGTEMLSHKGLEVNTASHQVFVNGKEKTFTAKEYELLVFLMSHSNIVFSKDHLFMTIWNEDHFGDTATVSVHIQKIRKKIEKDPANPQYIETIWGAGYRFNV